MFKAAVVRVIAGFVQKCKRSVDIQIGPKGFLVVARLLRVSSKVECRYLSANAVIAVELVTNRLGHVSVNLFSAPCENLFFCIFMNTSLQLQDRTCLKKLRTYLST